MNERLKKIFGIFQVLLGIAAIPINAENQIDLSDEQKQSLAGKMPDTNLEELLGQLNAELKKGVEGNLEHKALQDQINALVKEMQLENEINAGDNDSKGLEAKLSAINAKVKEQEALINKLIKEDLTNATQVIQINKNEMKHTATHLFGTNKQWDAVENRPWNENAINGGLRATNFNSDHLPILQGDLEHFVRENPTVIESAFYDMIELPKQWSTRTGVIDIVSGATIVGDEIVQARAKGWSPKNKHKIDVEYGRIFDKKIDIEFDGQELQKFERTWIQSLQNLDGTHPWKMSFIGFLMTELIKNQRRDDRIATINGIYSDNGGGNDNPGLNIESQDGLRYLYFYFRDVEKKYRPFTNITYAGVTMTEPTEENIVDYVRGIIESIPEHFRKDPGLEIQLSNQMLLWYRKAAGLEYQLHTATDSGKMDYKYNYPIDYPNYIFQPIHDWTGSKFIAITYSKNVTLLEFRPEEKRKFTVTHEKRNTLMFADYKQGIMLNQVGIKTKPNDQFNFERQYVWSNACPIFDSNRTQTLYDNETGIINYHYKDIKVDKGWKTDIEDIDNIKAGMVITITGDIGLIADKFVKNNAKFTIDSDFNLKTGGTLTLLVKPDLTLRELSRTTGPVVTTASAITFNTAAIDANKGKEFVFTGTTTTAINDIINGVEGQVIKIFGTATAGVDVTFANVAGKISVLSAATVSGADKYLELVKVAGIWYEQSRNV
jgi:hypothetical protein